MMPGQPHAAALGAPSKSLGHAGQEQVAVVAFDSDDAEIGYLQEGQIKALVVQNPFRMGYEGVQTAVAAINGEEVERNIDTGVTVVTTENFDTPEVQALLYPDLGE